jgi:GNAT superfamily N-acetyltransferase
MLRLLRSEDLTQCLELSREASWNQTLADWARLLQLAPAGCFAIEHDQQVVATATLVVYSAELAWIGMVLVRTSHRGRGFARHLLQHALAEASRLGVRCVKLDATDEGEPVYRKLGFVVECEVSRWQATAAPLAPSTTQYPLNFAEDAQCFGVDRSALLHSLREAGHLATQDGSFALYRPGDRAAYFGPALVQSEAAGDELIHRFTALHPQQLLYWDSFSDRTAMAGFQPVRHLRRMRLGHEVAVQTRRQFALAGFEWG